jgi:hypothetical protein
MAIRKGIICAVVGFGLFAMDSARAESVTFGAGWEKFSGHIDDTLQNPDHDDTTLPDHDKVELSQFDSSLGTLQSVKLTGNIDVLWGINVDTTNSTDPVNYVYGYHISFDAPSVSVGTAFVQAKLPPQGDLVSVTINPQSSYSASGEDHPFNSATVTGAALSDFIGSGKVDFNILFRDSAHNFDGSSANATESSFISWTGDVSVQYNYAPVVAVPLPAAVWGGAALLGLMAVGRAGRRVVKQI